jgi:hypothetical protein
MVRVILVGPKQSKCVAKITYTCKDIQLLVMLGNNRRDLYSHIEKGGCASWKFCIQTMTADQIDALDFDPFDVTKVNLEISYCY